MRARRIAILTFALLACRRSVDLPWSGNPPADLDAPRSIRATSAVQTIYVSWSPVADATQYRVTLDPTDNGGSAQISTSTTSATFGVVSTAIQEIHVTATVGGDETGPSPIVSARSIPGGHSGLVPLANASWTTTVGLSNDRFGYPVARAGDVDGDGFDDLLVAAYDSDVPGTNAGSLHLFQGGPAGLGSASVWSRTGTMTGQHFGAGICGGDFNGDGHADVAVGSPDWSNPENGEGLFQVFLGNGIAYATTAAMATEANVLTNSGRTLACPGDWNGDAFDDVFLGAPSLNNGQANEGLVVFGAGNGLATVPVSGVGFFESNVVGGRVGWSFSTPGDVNCDGTDEIAVGSLDAGYAVLFSKGDSSLASGKLVSGLTGPYGTALDLLDVDGDGCDELAIGTPRGGNGSVRVLSGTPAGLTTAGLVTITTAAASEIGGAIAGGDVNGDGFEDLLAGAPRYDGAVTEQGRVELYLGSASGLPAVPSWSWEPGVANARAGGSLSFLGDVNGDGSPDFAVGVYGDSSTPSLVGRAWVFHGPPQRGPIVDAGLAREVVAGNETALGATFSDPTGSSWSCEIDFGDGESQSLPSCSASGLASLVHAWPDGVSRVRVTVTNERGLAGSAVTTIIAQ